jgi:hypothetical protein
MLSLKSSQRYLTFSDGEEIAKLYFAQRRKERQGEAKCKELGAKW